MTNLKWCTTRVSFGKGLVGVVAVMSLLTSVPIARAQEGETSEVDDLRRQVRQLEAQVQALRAAINDSIDADRQQIAGMNRVLKGQGVTTSEGASSPARAEREAPDTARPPPSLPKSPPGKGAAARARRTPSGR